MERLPDDIIEVIFCKLDIVTIKSSKMVCKQWNRKLMDKSFLAFYSGCRTRPQQQWLIDTDNLDMYSIEDKERKRIVENLQIKLPASLTPAGTFAKILGSSNGLWIIGVITKPYQLEKLLVCNPLTEKICMEIPCPEQHVDFRALDFAGMHADTSGLVLVIKCNKQQHFIHDEHWRFSHCNWETAGFHTEPPFYILQGPPTHSTIYAYDPVKQEAEKLGEMARDIKRIVLEWSVVVFRCKGGEIYSMGMGKGEGGFVPFVCKFKYSNRKWDIVSEFQEPPGPESRLKLECIRMKRFSWSNQLDRICVGGTEYNISTNEWCSWEQINSETDYIPTTL